MMHCMRIAFCNDDIQSVKFRLFVCLSMGQSVGVSAATGEGMDEFVEKIAEATEEYER